MKETILAAAKEALLIEIEAIKGLESYLNDDFGQVVETLMQCKGKLVVSGIGKSAIIAQKIVATCISTGTAAAYLHAADAIHGDSGLIGPEDVVMIISKSGESPEIKSLIQLIQGFGNTIIGMTGNQESHLAKSSKYILNTYVTKEACAINLAPTSSTTAQMVMGDLVAIALMKQKQFTAHDFAKYHPGGNLGKRLTLTTSAIANTNTKPSVHLTTSLKEVILNISKNRLGATVVVDDAQKVLGIITDGDIRRMLEHHNNFDQLTAKDIYHVSPKTIASNTLAVEALQVMEQNDISQLIVADNNVYIGMIHMHDLMKEGIL